MVKIHLKLVKNHFFLKSHLRDIFCLQMYALVTLAHMFGVFGLLLNQSVFNSCWDNLVKSYQQLECFSSFPISQLPIFAMIFNDRNCNIVMKFCQGENKKTILLHRLQAQTLPDGTIPISKIHPFRKIAITLLTLLCNFDAL